MADANPHNEHYATKAREQYAIRDRCNKAEREIEELEATLATRKGRIALERDAAQAEIDKYRRWQEKLQSESYDKKEPTPIHAQPDEMKTEQLGLLDWKALSVMSQVDRRFLTLINGKKQLHDEIEKEKTRWLRPARLLFTDDEDILDRALIRGNTMWLRDVAYNDNYNGKNNLKLQTADESTYVLGDSAIPCDAPYNYGGKQCAYFLEESALMSVDWATGGPPDILPYRHQSFAMAGCNGNLYVSVDNELRCYTGSVTGAYRVVRTFEKPVCDMFKSLERGMPNNRLQLCPLVVLSESLIVYRPAQINTAHYQYRDHVVVWDGYQEIEVRCPYPPCMVAYSGRTLAVTTSKDDIDTAFPSRVYLYYAEYPHDEASDDKYSDGTCFDIERNICQIIGDTHGAFIVRTTNQMLFRLTAVTGYQPIPPRFLMADDKGEEVTHTLNNIHTMFFDNENLIVIGDEDLGGGGILEGRVIVFDPDYKYKSSFPG